MTAKTLEHIYECHGVGRSTQCSCTLARSGTPPAFCKPYEVDQKWVDKWLIPPEPRHPCNNPVVAWQEDGEGVSVSKCTTKTCHTKCLLGDTCSTCRMLVNQRRVYRSGEHPCGLCSPCPPEPVVDCSPNLPGTPQPWRPNKAAVRGPTAPRWSQIPWRPRLGGPCYPCPNKLQACERPSPARDLVLPRSNVILDKPCQICPRPILRKCNPRPVVPVYTCGTIGNRSCIDRITTYYHYPGYLDVESGFDVKCNPRIPCRDLIGLTESDAARKPVDWKTFSVIPPRGLQAICGSDSE